jgi:hypothetical protein
LVEYEFDLKAPVSERDQTSSPKPLYGGRTVAKKKVAKKAVKKAPKKSPKKAPKKKAAKKTAKKK